MSCIWLLVFACLHRINYRAIGRSATAASRIQVNIPYLHKTAGSRLAVRPLSSSLNLSGYFNDTPYA
ncbi:hypothetical protein QUB63_21265 [Microcoleus sp. ARI1-B5]|uniref:hypothetical protein n=1 Tax=unclassified Microcoleus TaxID=2642155 RepID=UPI002FD67D54